jgi:phosphatidylinositol alpha-mannosyltransferase
MTSLRIGVLSASLPRAGRKPGGVDVHVHRLSNRLALRGHRVRVASFSPAPPDARYEAVALRPAGLGERTLTRISAASVAFNLLDTSDLDVVHLHGDDWFYLRRGVPTVRTFHGSALMEARHATRARRRALQLVCFAGELLAARLATASYGLIPGDGRPYRARGPLPIGVDVPPAADLARGGPPTVLFVGTWEGRKRGRLLHEVFLREVLPRVPDARLQLVCETPAGPAGSPGVEWLGAPDDATLAELYSRAWVFCLPSSYEGFGLPYVEAMARGTPVVATPNPGSRHVLTSGRDGLLAPPAQLGAAIVRLLRDEPYRLELARRARERALAFSWDAALAAHECAYLDAIARHGSSA